MLKLHAGVHWAVPASTLPPPSRLQPRISPDLEVVVVLQCVQQLEHDQSRGLAIATLALIVLLDLVEVLSGHGTPLALAGVPVLPPLSVWALTLTVTPLPLTLRLIIVLGL